MMNELTDVIHNLTVHRMQNSADNRQLCHSQPVNDSGLNFEIWTSTCFSLFVARLQRSGELLCDITVKGSQNTTLSCDIDLQTSDRWLTDPKLMSLLTVKLVHGQTIYLQKSWIVKYDCLTANPSSCVLHVYNSAKRTAWDDFAIWLSWNLWSSDRKVRSSGLHLFTIHAAVGIPFDNQDYQ